jgi:hypothetical protein
MYKQIVAVLVTVVVPLMSNADACSGGGGKGDNEAVVVCQTNGYHKAGRAEKTAKGNFMTCGGKFCQITIKFPNTKTSTNQTRVLKPKDQTDFNVPKNASSFSSKNCGTLYKRNVKKA